MNRASCQGLSSCLITAVLFVLAVAANVSDAAEAADASGCECWAVTSVVCGSDGNTYQNKCFAECQGVPVITQGPCTTASAAGPAMAQALTAVLAADTGLNTVLAAAGVAPLTPQQLDGVAAAASGVAVGFDRALPARLVTATDMYRFSADGLVLVGVMRPVSRFAPNAPPVPDDAVLSPSDPYDNFGATEAVATLTGLLYKPRALAHHAALSALAAAQVAGEEAAAAAAAAATPPDSITGSIAAKLTGLVGLEPFLPADITANAQDLGHEGFDEPDNSTDPSTNPPEPPALPPSSGNDTDGESDDGSEPPPDGGNGSTGSTGSISDSGSSSSSSSGLPAGTAASSGVLAASRLRGRRLLKVFPPDNRVELVARQRSLVRAVGRITYDLDDSSYFCSGAMVGRRTVLTAAHCVMSVDTPGLAASAWKFSPDHNKQGSDPRFGRSAAARFYFDTRFWTSGQWWLWDLAVVVLEQPLGRKTGYFGVGYMPKGYSGSLYTAGYPGDKPLWSFWWIPGGNRCSVKDTDGTDTVMTHKCDTYPGQSGSPMWIPGTSTILGVVSWESTDLNGACAVNAFWYAFIRKHRTARALPLATPP